MAAASVGTRPSAVVAGAARDYAVFDLDRTLLRGSSLGIFARELADRGLVGRFDLLRHALHESAFALSGLSSHSLERICRRVVAASAGHCQGDVIAAADDVAPRVAARLYPAARWLLAQHASRGDTAILLSAGPQELVAAVARTLGLQMAIGTTADVQRGVYTGALSGSFCHGEGKLERLRSVLGPVELLRTTAYADSTSDLPVLRSVGHPIAVNPDRGLAAAADAARWPILRLA